MRHPLFGVDLDGDPILPLGVCGLAGVLVGEAERGVRLGTLLVEPERSVGVVTRLIEEGRIAIPHEELPHHGLGEA